MSAGRMRAAPETPPRILDKDNTTGPSTPVGSPLEVPGSSKCTPSPRLSTLKKKGMELFAGMGYSSSDPWADEGDHGVPPTRTKASQADHLRTLRTTPLGVNKSTSPVRELRPSSSTPSDDEDKEDLIGYLESLNLKPQQTIGRSVMRGFNASMARSPRSSPLRSAGNSPARSTTGSPSKTVRGSPLKPDPSVSSLGMIAEEAVEQKKSMWDADNDEFENWPGQET
jgi:hypothetical protein